MYTPIIAAYKNKKSHIIVIWVRVKGRLTVGFGVDGNNLVSVLFWQVNPIVNYLLMKNFFVLVKNCFFFKLIY